MLHQIRLQIHGYATTQHYSLARVDVVAGAEIETGTRVRSCISLKVAPRTLGKRAVECRKRCSTNRSIFSGEACRSKAFFYRCISKPQCSPQIESSLCLHDVWHGPRLACGSAPSCAPPPSASCSSQSSKWTRPVAVNVVSTALKRLNWQHRIPCF